MIFYIDLMHDVWTVVWVVCLHTIFVCFCKHRVIIFRLSLIHVMQIKVSIKHWEIFQNFFNFGVASFKIYWLIIDCNFLHCIVPIWAENPARRPYRDERPAWEVPQNNYTYWGNYLKCRVFLVVNSTSKSSLKNSLNLFCKQLAIGSWVLNFIWVFNFKTLNEFKWWLGFSINYIFHAVSY
jgi:hypothetical protein